MKMNQKGILNTEKLLTIVCVRNQLLQVKPFFNKNT